MSEKMVPVKNLYLIFAICVGLLALGIGSTYAIFTATAEISNPIVIASNLSYDSNLMETISVTVPAGETVSNKLNVTNSSGESLSYIIYYLDEGLDVELGTSSGSSTGSLASSASTTVEVQVRNNTENSVTVIIGILSGSQDLVLGTGMVMVPSEELSIKLSGAALYITNLYLNNKDATLVERDGISYRYASSVRLMNDRQASMEVGEDAGNIRYYGKDDTTVSDDLKNYVYFNCSDYSNQSSSTCELWRIIGVFDGKVKIARNNILTDSSGSNVNLAWDQDKNINSSVTTYSNNWKESSLQLMLNSSYYNGDTAGEITYYSGSDGTTTATLNMSSIGIKNDTTRELISLSTWYLGGYSSPSGLYANDIYIHERSGLTGTIYGDNPPTTEANIGLMYASDYSYTADLSVCSKDIYNYDTDATNCAGTAWLLQSNGTNTNQWLINPRSSSSDTAWNVNSSGRVNYIIVIPPLGVRPVLYLDSTVDFGSGDGTQNTPFQISVG